MADEIVELFNKEAIRARKSVSATDDYGQPTFDESLSSSFLCALQPDDGTYQVTVQGELKIGSHRLYCLATEDIIAGDEVIIDSLRYRVLAVLDDSGRGHHFKVMLERVT